MSRIIRAFIYEDYRSWHAYVSLKRTKTDEPLMFITYGLALDYKDEAYDLFMFMRKSIYDKIVSGDYTVKIQDDKSITLVIVDQEGHRVRPIYQDIIY